VRAQACADIRHPGRAGLALVGRGLDLDEFVRPERAVDFGNHGLREALVADDDDGGEVVGFGAQFAAAGGGHGWHRRIMTRFAGGGLA
jgi:hypothetical protein